MAPLKFSKTTSVRSAVMATKSGSVQLTPAWVGLINNSGRQMLTPAVCGHFLFILPVGCCPIKPGYTLYLSFEIIISVFCCCSGGSSGGGSGCDSGRGCCGGCG